VGVYTHKDPAKLGEFNVSCSVLTSSGSRIGIDHQGADALRRTAKAFRYLSDEVGTEAYQQGQTK